MPRDELARVLVLSRHLRLERDAPSGAAYLLGEREHHAVRAPDVAAVIEALDGFWSVGDVVEVCSRTISPVRVLQILAGLERQGLVIEAREGAPERLAFEAGLPLLHEAPSVELVAATASDAATRAMAEALRGAGFEPGAQGIRVIVATDYLAPACADRAFEALRSGRACFLVKPGGLRPFIGPYFTGAGGEACPRCLSDCLGDQRPVERLLQRARPDTSWPEAPAAALPASLAAAANLAALRLRAVLAQGSPAALAGLLWTLDLPRFELEQHRVRRRPQCPACGDPTLQARLGERPITLGPMPIAFDQDGGFRREPPAESYARLAHLVSPILGPVTHLCPMPGRHSEACPVYSAGYLVVPARGTESFDRRCAGKGSTVEQARMSALAEAIERFSGVHRGDEAAVRASLAQLGDDAIPPAALQLFSPAQEAAGGSTPPPLDPGTTITWTPAWSLGDGRRRYVPLAYCYTEARAEDGALFCRPSSNGSAAGNGLDEAILQGLFEAVERDAVAMWWYCRVKRPPALVPPSTAATFEAQRAAYDALGWTLWALDLTHDIGLSVTVAVATHPPSDRLALGFGCHSDAALAMRRALSELNQVFDPGASTASPWDGMAASKLDHLRPDRSAPRAAPAPPVPSRDLRVHVETWARRLRDLGLETLVVDKTRPDLGLSVAQVIVPGLRHAWPRFAPGRLYDVPHRLGWTGRPLAEGELNPQHLLI